MGKNDREELKSKRNYKKNDINYTREEFLEYRNKMTRSQFNENIEAICNHFDIKIEDLHICTRGFTVRDYIFRPEVAEYLKVIFNSYEFNPYYDKRNSLNKKLQIDLEETKIIDNITSASKISEYTDMVMKDINSLPEHLKGEIVRNNGYEFNYMLGKYLPLVVDHLTLLFTVMAKNSHVSAGNIFEEIIESIQKWVSNYQKRVCLKEFIGYEIPMFNMDNHSNFSQFEEQQYTIDEVLSKALKPFLGVPLCRTDLDEHVEEYLEAQDVDKARDAYWESKKSQVSDFNSKQLEEYDLRAKNMQRFLVADSATKDKKDYRNKIKHNLIKECRKKICTGIDRNFEYDGINYMFFVKHIPISSSDINSISIKVLSADCTETTKFIFKDLIKFYIQKIITMESSEFKFDADSIKDFFTDPENIENALDYVMRDYPELLFKYLEKFESSKQEDLYTLFEDLNEKGFDYKKFSDYLKEVKAKFDTNVDEILEIEIKAEKAVIDLWDELNTKENIESKYSRNMKYLLDKAIGQMLLVLFEIKPEK